MSLGELGSYYCMNWWRSYDPNLNWIAHCCPRQTPVPVGNSILQFSDSQMTFLNQTGGKSFSRSPPVIVEFFTITSESLAWIVLFPNISIWTFSKVNLEPSDRSILEKIVELRMDNSDADIPMALWCFPNLHPGSFQCQLRMRIHIDKKFIICWSGCSNRPVYRWYLSYSIRAR